MWLKIFEGIGIFLTISLDTLTIVISSGVLVIPVVATALHSDDHSIVENICFSHLWRKGISEQRAVTPTQTFERKQCIKEQTAATPT